MHEGNAAGKSHPIKIQRCFGNIPLQIALVSNWKVQEFEMEGRVGLPSGAITMKMDGWV